MGLPTCRRCGKSDPSRMVGLMTLWFGPFIEIEPAHGYFHLCPPCYDRLVAPHMEDVQGKLAHLHPGVAAYLERERDRHPDAAEPEADSPPSDAPGSGDPGRDEG